MKVLITDGNNRSSLAVARSLGKKGIKVVVGAESNDSLSGASKYCYRKFRYPSPSSEPKEFLKIVGEIGTAEDIDIIYPMSDLTMDIVLSYSGDLEARMLRALPGYESYSLVSDKMKLAKLASRIGIAVPDSVLIKSKDEVMDACENIEYPIVVKPIRSSLYCNGRYIDARVKYVKSKGQLVSLYEETDYLKQPFIIQKIIKGYGTAIFSLFDHGEPILYFSHRRLRERPPSGGVSVLRESIPLEDSMLRGCEKILREANWNGVAMVEFKKEETSGIPYLMEVNGRFWGSLQLAIDSGADFPYLLFWLAMNMNVRSSGEYVVGRKSRWLLGDLDHLYFRVLKKEGNEGLGKGLRSKGKAIVDFFKYNGRQCNFEVLRFEDIRPFIVELKEYVHEACGVK